MLNLFLFIYLTFGFRCAPGDHSPPTPSPVLSLTELGGDDNKATVKVIVTQLSKVSIKRSFSVHKDTSTYMHITNHTK